VIVGVDVVLKAEDKTEVRQWPSTEVPPIHFDVAIERMVVVSHIVRSRDPMRLTFKGISNADGVAYFFLR
jgi:hypothetical protein